MKSLSKALVAAALLATVACAKSKGTDLQNAPPVINQGSAVGSGIKVEFNPKLDVLFVIDNSMSMEDEQTKLRAAISRFVDGFGENSFIDYRVGVISVYDSERCGKPNPQNNGEINKCYPQGKLQPVRDASGAVVSSASFVQRGEGAAEILKSTLNIGALTLKDGGPESEEMFNPILVATSAAGNAANSGFIRPDSHVVIVIVSDEEDGSINLNPASFMQRLYSNIPEERLSLYGVLAIKGCTRQSYAKAPERIELAIGIHGGKTYKICDANFGANLANMGSRIRQKLYRINPIPLASTPADGSLKLFYGNTEIPMGQGWTHNLSLNRVEIDETLNVQFVEGQRFRVDYQEVSARAIKKNRAKVINR